MTPMPDARLAGAAALASACLLGGCSAPTRRPGEDSGSAAAPAPRPTHVAQFLPRTTPAVPETATPPPGHPAPAPVTDPPPPAVPAPCDTGGLRLSLGPEGGSAGSVYYPLLFTNSSSTDCTLYGYPGVAFVTGPGGSVIGEPAVRNPELGAELVRLAPGGTAHASLQVAVAANYPASICRPATAHWLQVDPPGQYASLFLPLTAQTCTGPVPAGSTLGIFVVRPGATGP
jgi:hypothetical protein